MPFLLMILMAVIGVAGWWWDLLVWWPELVLCFMPLAAFVGGLFLRNSSLEVVFDVSRNRSPLPVGGDAGGDPRTIPLEPARFPLAIESRVVSLEKHRREGAP